MRRFSICVIAALPWVSVHADIDGDGDGDGDSDNDNDNDGDGDNDGDNDNDNDGDNDGDGDGEVVTGFVQGARIAIAGRERTYSMFVPGSYDAGKAYPLVVVVHGDGGTGAQIRGAFGLEAVAAEGAIFLYPDGLNHTWKQADKPETNEDFFFFDGMVAKTTDSYHVDTKRIFVTGFSSGGYMANQLGCYRGGTIRAIAPMSGGGPYDAVGGHYDAEGHLTCNVKPVAAMIIHGDIDGVVGWGEGQKSLSHWSWANRCGSPPPDGADACKALTCSQPVTFCTVRGKGHQIWAEAPTRVWQFFSGFR